MDPRGKELSELLIWVRQAGEPEERRRRFEDFWRSAEALVQLFVVRFRPPASCDGTEFRRELVNDVAIACFRGLDTYRGTGPVGAWLRQIAKRKLIDKVREVNRWEDRTVSLDALGSGAGNRSPGLREDILNAAAVMRLDDLRPPLPMPLDELEGTVRHRVLIKSLEILALSSHMGNRHARTLWARIWENKTIGQIAAEAGVSDREVYRWQRDGRAALRDILATEFNITGLHDL